MDATAATLPATGAPSEADAGSSSPKDAGKESSVDAGPPPPVPGTPCPTIDQIKTKKCGACGEQATLCLGSGDAGSDGGGGTWSEYGTCDKQLAGGCIPGTTVTESCGHCGTRVKTCSPYCGFAIAACKGEPPMSCVPGAVDLSNAGCTVAGTYHQRTCGTACTYPNYGATCDPAPTTITVGPTVGNVTSTIATLTSTQTAASLSGSCPAATLGPVTPYVHLKVHNPMATSVVVSVYNSVAPGGVVFPTLLASYGATTPTTAALRKACVQGVNDFGDDLLTGDSYFASLSDVDAITIPANGTVTIYNGAQDPYSAAMPGDSTGSVLVNVRLEQIN
ncbi:MAG: hypothetical protein QOI41_3046 [Myxococcales bacterium]|jgi:hypothetical protein|nr:hypothetical protein [Myxococcales bacterium]